LSTGKLQSLKPGNCDARSDMASVTDFHARGKILSITGNVVVFAPLNTNYELRLDAAGSLEGAQTGVVIDAIISATPRKIWTVSSGGNFIAPIFGPPRIIQGRVRYLEETFMIVQAGVPIVVSLPKDEKIYDLTHGAVTLAGLVNVAAQRGASFKLAPKTEAVTA
jgi:hypothetical protein